MKMSCYLRDVGDTVVYLKRVAYFVLVSAAFCQYYHFKW